MTTSAVRGPVREAERALAPDLARGSMLLLISLANAMGVVFASAPGVAGSPGWLNLVMFSLVNARAYPVFAVMFGYGLVQLWHRQRVAGASEAQARAVLLRRNGWLLAFGFGHAALLYFGDFLGAYGIVGMALTVLLLPRGERAHRWVRWLWALSAVEVVGLAARMLLSLRGGSAGVPLEHIGSLAAPDYRTATLDRLAEWPMHTATVLPFALIVWLGCWAARHRLLEEPGRHLRLLRWTAAAGLGVAVLGGLPLALLSAGLLHADAASAATMSMLYGTSGMFAGPGYVAVFALVSRLVSRQTAVVGALCALGQRSLSGYLMQSVAWLVLLAPYTLALASRSANPGLLAAGVAVAVWLATVLASAWLDRRGRPGPAELLLRRLAYRGGTRAAQPSRPLG